MCEFQHQSKFSETNQKTAKARNDYILALVSANAAIRKFFVDDQPELINVCIALFRFFFNIARVRPLVITFIFLFSTKHPASADMLRHMLRL